MLGGASETSLVTESAVADGRRRRGAESRRSILEAASAVIVRDGVAALTHRAVAEAADVPLARVSYHYPTTDELLVAAATEYMTGFHHQVREMATSAFSAGRPIIDACTDFLMELMSERSEEFLSMVEVRLAMHRMGSDVEFAQIVGVISSFGPSMADAASIVSALFGFALLGSTSPLEVDRNQVRAYVERVLRGFR